MSDAGWGYSIRWPMLNLGDEPFTLRHELDDRQLEHHLDAPAQRLASPSFLSTDATLDQTSRIAHFSVRWERLLGGFVAFSASGNGTGTALTDAKTWGIPLPSTVTPVTAVGRYAPAMGYWQVTPGPTGALVGDPIALAWRRTSDNQWMVVDQGRFVGSSWGASTSDTFTMHAVFPAVR